MAKPVSRGGVISRSFLLLSVCVRPLRKLSSQVMATDRARFEKDWSSLFAASLKEEFLKPTW